MKVKSESEVTQSCPTLSDPMDCSLPGSSIHGIFQARVLEWGAIAFSALYYFNDCRFVVQSESGSLIPPALFFFLMIALTLHDPDNYNGVITHLGEGNGNPLQYSCLENPMDGGAW